jgi:hypothetical protein
MNAMLSGTGNGLLTARTIDQMISPQIEIDSLNAAGLGVILSGSDRDFRFWHNGKNEGHLSLFVSYPRKKQGYAILVNSGEGEGLIRAIETEILKSFA